MKEILNICQSTAFSLMLCLLLCFGIQETHASEGVAQVIVLRGEVKAKLPDGSIVDVAKDMWVQEGTVLQSAVGSFCRLLFNDRSTMNLGPDSQMVIDQFPENAAGIITLMKGQVRSNVTKDYMNNQETDKSKLFIKTKTAAMGVRGTDFQVNFNPANNNTALITFSGAVAMAQFDSPIGDRSFSRDVLERAVSSERAVLVKQGEFSGVTPQTSRATIPTRLNPVQLETLKKNETGVQADGSATRERREFRNPIPPGVDSKAFSNNPTQSMAQTMASTLGSEVARSVTQQVSSERSAVSSVVPVEGFRDVKTGTYAPPAGSVIDLATVSIIPPPKGSTFDPISQTYVIPPELGRVNPQTGAYEAPRGMQLTNEGTLVRTAPDATSSTRSPASVVNTQPVNETLRVTMDAEVSKTDLSSSNEFEVEKLAEERLVENERQIELELEQKIIENNRTNVSFDFTVTP